MNDIKKGRYKNSALFISDKTEAEIINIDIVRDYFFTSNHDIDFSYYITGRNEISNTDIKSVGITSPSGIFSSKIYDRLIRTDSLNGYIDLFTEDISYSDLLAAIMSFDIIFLSFDIDAFAFDSVGEFEKRKREFVKLKSILKKYPGRLFIVVTPVPLAHESISEEYRKKEIRRTRLLCNYLKNDLCVNNSVNLTVFDLFDLLALSDENSINPNTLKPEYIGTERNQLSESAGKFIAYEIIDLIKFTSKRLDRYELKILN